MAVRPPSPAHRVHNRAVVERSCGKVHRQTSQHGVKADGFENGQTYPYVLNTADAAVPGPLAV